MKPRDVWATRMGVILAMAGNAIGLGNFLRFPSQAAQNGGGVFMIPYFVALVLIGIPLMWCELAMGRLGGASQRGSSPGVFDLLWKHPFAKYLGALGIVLPIAVMIYYCYIESWTLAFAFFSVAESYFGHTAQDAMRQFLHHFQGVDQAWGVSFAAYFFFLLTMALNYLVLSGGIARGIERLANIGMPLLFVMALVLVARVFTLGTPDPAHPENNVLNGFGFIWNPDFSRLRNAKVWLAAAGQIFFTLSVGFGAMQCYASYLRRRDDIVITGLSTAMTNEFAEVILGGSIAIPIAFAFFGSAATQEIARSGSFNIGFVAMPVIFQRVAAGPFLGLLWFFLLFVAGLTSSVALTQPAVTFLQDELGWSRRRAVLSVIGLVFVAAHIPLLGLRAGALDELDFWAGTVGLALFGFLEVLVFFWLFGAERAWAEIHLGAEVRLPRVFFLILKYLTPVLLLVIFVAWAGQSGWAMLTLRDIPPADRPWRWAARLLLAGLLLLTLGLVRRAARHGPRRLP